MAIYQDLIKRYKEQDPRLVFAHFSFRQEIGETWEAPFQKLADKAVKEDWNYSSLEYKRDGKNFPILMSYLNQTFLRLQEQGKIKYSKDNQKACFNVGLQTPEGKDIYATFFRNNKAEELQQSDWTLFGYFDGYSAHVKEFEPLPGIATYIDEPSDLVYNHNYEFEVDYAHILEDNKERLPSVLLGNNVLARHAVKGAIQQLREKLARNYKLAVPHWYNGRIQLLLPLAITDDYMADVALVAEKDDDRKKYMIRTILTLDMAYQDARVICSPDRFWLNP